MTREDRRLLRRVTRESRAPVPPRRDGWPCGPWLPLCRWPDCDCYPNAPRVPPDPTPFPPWPAP